MYLRCYTQAPLQPNSVSKNLDETFSIKGFVDIIANRAPKKARSKYFLIHSIQISKQHQQDETKRQGSTQSLLPRSWNFVPFVKQVSRKCLILFPFRYAISLFFLGLFLIYRFVVFYVDDVFDVFIELISQNVYEWWWILKEGNGPEKNEPSLTLAYRSLTAWITI